ncbi:MAG: hypothetical protein J5903_04390 [Clostridia bacterium]|nr:hypothetical protein [Clostridia bacterium]
MKKFVSVIVAAIMIAALIPAVVNADYVRSGNNGNVIVPYTTGEGITIDGILSQGEWPETNKLSLNENTLVGWVGDNFTGPIDYYYSWGDKGLYMAAIVVDNTIVEGTAPVGEVFTRFQIAFNPAGIICDSYPGLFFSVGPEKDTGKCNLMRHNWDTSEDNGYVVPAEEEFEGRYTYIEKDGEIIGWNMECVIPWNMISSEDRYTDLDETDSITLDHFNPRDENRKRAFCTATIAYVQSATKTDSGLATGRTCTDGDANVWTVNSYDLILLFALPGETNRSTETEYFTPSDATAEEDTTEVPDNETTAEETKDEVTTTADETDSDTTAAAPVTDAQTDKTTETEKNTGLPLAAIIGIIAAAVVVVVVIIVIVIIGKKKNNK